MEKPEREERFTKKDWLEIGFGAAQTLIFFAMLWSMWQTKESLDISRKQFEATIEPAVYIDLSKGMAESKGTTHFSFLNVGPVPVWDLQVEAILFATVTPSTNEFFGTLKPGYMEAKPRPLVRGRFASGAVTNIPTETVLGGDPLKPNYAVEGEVVGVVIGYRRQVDMKHYHQLLTMEKTITPSGATIVMGFYQIGGDAPNMIDVAKLRSDFEEQFRRAGITDLH